MPDFAQVKVPATSANCGAGFDTLGFACTLYNTFTLSYNDENIIKLDVTGEGSGYLKPSEGNFAIKAIRKIFNEAGIKEQGINLKMENEIPMSRGLGSSSAALVGGMMVANELLNNPFSQDEIFNFATEMEGHPDNVAPAIYGGMTVSIMENSKPFCIKITPPDDLKLIAVVPSFPLSTKQAREILPQKVPFKDATFNISRAALFVAAICEKQNNFLKYALKDKLHQPYRGTLIPGMDKVFEAACEAGALGSIISGAGSTLMSFADINAEPEKIGNAMCSMFKKLGKDAVYHILDFDDIGAKTI